MPLKLRKFREFQTEVPELNSGKDEYMVKRDEPDNVDPYRLQIVDANTTSRTLKDVMAEGSLRSVYGSLGLCLELLNNPITYSQRLINTDAPGKFYIAFPKVVLWKLPVKVLTYVFLEVTVDERSQVKFSLYFVGEYHRFSAFTPVTFLVNTER